MGVVFIFRFVTLLTMRNDVERSGNERKIEKKSAALVFHLPPNSVCDACSLCITELTSTKKINNMHMNVNQPKTRLTIKNRFKVLQFY